MIRVRIGIAARMVGVSTKTLRRWNASGKLSCSRTVGGHRRVSVIEIERLTGSTREEVDDGGVGSPGDDRVAVYCRVSSHEQKAKGDLDRQVQVAVEHCTASGSRGPEVYTDVGSGLNARRGGLKRLCKAIERGSVQRVVVTFKDRLTRFGFGYLDRYFKSHGASITVLRQAATRSMHEELVDDLIAIVTSFSGRVHGMRGHHGRGANRVDSSFWAALKQACNKAWRRAVASAMP
jgi:putative resolvase